MLFLMELCLNEHPDPALTAAEAVTADREAVVHDDQAEIF